MSTRIIRIPALASHSGKAPRAFVLAALAELSGKQTPFDGPAVTLALPEHMQASILAIGRPWAIGVYRRVADMMLRYVVTTA
jgi:hypothetical protein